MPSTLAVSIHRLIIQHQTQRRPRTDSARLIHRSAFSAAIIYDAKLNKAFSNRSMWRWFVDFGAAMTFWRYTHIGHGQHCFGFGASPTGAQLSPITTTAQANVDGLLIVFVRITFPRQIISKLIREPRLCHKIVIFFIFWKYPKWNSSFVRHRPVALAAQNAKPSAIEYALNASSTQIHRCAEIFIRWLLVVGSWLCLSLLDECTLNYN